MRAPAVVLAIAAAATVGIGPVVAAAQTSGTAPAAKRKKPQEVIRTAHGSVIEPTRTIIHNPNGTTTIITVPRRSYLNPGTDVPRGYRHRWEYAFPVGGDPGQPYWYFGPPNVGAVGGIPIAPFLLRGVDPSYPGPY